VSTHVRFLAGCGAAALALALTACGSGSDKGDGAKGASAAAGASGGSAGQGSADCPAEHTATVDDTKLGGKAEIDLCTLPEAHKATVSVPWAMVVDRPKPYGLSHVLNVFPVSCKSDSEDSCTLIKKKVDMWDEGTCGGSNVKPDCHPQRNEEVSVVCLAKYDYGKTENSSDPSARWYGVLLDKRLLATGTDGSETSSVDAFTDKGGKPVGFIDAKEVNKVSVDLPACDGTMLHGADARDLAQMEGLPVDKG
jgi:hypothetical protein